MSDSFPSNASAGVGFVGLLTILFIGLKLCGTIDWSWWWVLSPLWISAGILAIICLIIVIGLGLALIVDRWA